MSKIVTERLKQNIEAYMTSPSTAKKIWNGDVSLILSSTLNNKQAGKLFYLVGDNSSIENMAYGVIKIMPGEKVRKKDLTSLTEFHGYSKEEIDKKWPTKQVLYSYKFKLLDIFPTPLQVRVDPKNGTIENLDIGIEQSKVELNENLFKDIVLSENFIGYEGDNIFINQDIDLNEILQSKLNEELPFSQYVNFSKGSVNNGIYRLKLEKVVGDTEPLVEISNDEIKSFESDEEIREELNDSTKYVIEEMSSNDVVIIQKNNDKISILNEDNTDFKLNNQIKDNLKMLYGGNYVIKAYNSDNLEVFDCLYINDSDVTKQKWFDRKAKLNSMNFNNNIQKLDSTVVDSVDSVIVASKLRALNKKDVSIKKWDSTCENSEVLVKTFTPEVVRVHDVYTTEEDTEILSVRNEGFFKTWSPQMAYYLGLLVTDSHIDYPNGLVEFMISNEDRESVNGLAKVLGGISPKPINNSIRLRWRSKAMLEDLKKLKATGLKESRMTHTIVPEAYKWDYLRGIFDADGNNYKGRLQMDNSCGAVLKWAFKQFKTVAGKDAHLYQYTKHWKSPHYKIVVLGEGAVKLHKRLYFRKPFLTRKGKWAGK